MKKYRLSILFLIFGLWLQAVPLVIAQGPLWGIDLQQESPNLFVDFARFRSDDADQVRLDLYYQVFNAGLEFTEKDGEWLARYKVEVIIEDHKGRSIASESKEKQVRVSEESRAKSKTDHRTSQFSFDLKPGKYVINFALRDQSSNRVTNRRLETKLDKFDSHKPDLSDVEFLQAVHQATDSGGIFQKGNLRAIPSVNRVFGGSDDSRLLYYVEIYQGSDSDQSVIAETRLRHRSKGMVYRDTLHVAFTSSVERQLREISLTELPPGEYEMELFLRGRRNKKLVHHRYNFELLWTLDALVRFDWEKAITQLSYIAGPGELQEIKKKESIEERKRAFVEFWRERDPTAGTSQNEAKQEFYRRIRVANQRFSILRREGWRTDRGHIYIQFGEPDEVDDVPYSPNSFPYQIWHYYMSGRYKRFTFVDERMDGDYQLAFPYDGLYQTPDF
jgi:GWxTD domain-containing protein